MRDTLPDVLVDERLPTLFLVGFSSILCLLIAILAWVAVTRHRAQRMGVYRKYVVADDPSAPRRIRGRE